MKKVRVGVIGVGYLGQFHAEKYARMPDVDLVGVLDVESARLAQVANKLGTKAFREPTELLGKVDAVTIAVPTILHHQVARQFLAERIHVLLEKPMTVTLAQADDLIGLAARNGVVLQIGHIERFNPAVTAVKERIQSPRYLTAERAAPFTVRCTDVNVVLDLMIHDLDIVADLAGSDPREVSAAGASVITNEIDIATARIVFRNGCIADVAASRISDEKKRLLRVFDGERMYVSDYQTQKAIVTKRGGKTIPELVPHDISFDRRDTLEEEIRAFIRCIRDGVRPLVSGIEGRRALALARMITENIEKGMSGFASMP
jgi:predicted dehydrogenase